MKLKKFFCLMLSGALFMSLLGCSGEPQLRSKNLMAGYKSQNIAATEISQSFYKSTADFSVNLFRRSLQDGKNTFVSPLSVMFALGMTINGANGETLSQAETMLGSELSTLNSSLYSLKNGLKSQNKSKLKISNAIWVREGFDVSTDFLQTNADYYNAAAYSAAFDQSTVDDINKWVRWKTDKMIDGIIDSLSPEHMMYLINAIAFDAEWQTKFATKDVINGDFTNYAGVRQPAEYMVATEYKYINSDAATGFIKPYHGGDYSFAALLPTGDMSEFLSDLSGESLLEMLGGATQTAIKAWLPKFDAEYEITLNNVLQQMGLVDAFSPFAADFSGMTADGTGGLYIGDVVHKTYVSVDENGTKAAAVTGIGMKATSLEPELPTVILDRPFVYAIVDNASGLPIFLGVLNNCAKK